MSAACSPSGATATSGRIYEYTPQPIKKDLARWLWSRGELLFLSPPHAASPQAEVVSEAGESARDVASSYTRPTTPYLITSSGRASSDGGTSGPGGLAVLLRRRRRTARDATKAG